MSCPAHSSPNLAEFVGIRRKVVHRPSKAYRLNVPQNSFKILPKATGSSSRAFCNNFNQKLIRNPLKNTKKHSWSFFRESLFGINYGM